MIPYCGECPFMKYESIDGYGWCNIRDREVYCGDQCNVAHNELTNKGAIKILHYAQKWRRGAKIQQIPPYLLGVGIDRAIKELRQRRRDNEVDS